MNYKTANINKCVIEFNRFLGTNIITSNLDSNHQRIRQFFIDNYYTLKQQSFDKYQLDLELGLKFYEFMNGEPDFCNKFAADYDFWRYVAVFDIPDIIVDRFGSSDSSLAHFYGKSTRVYPYVLYWYINLSWQGNSASTREILSKNDEDIILQVVERPSKLGINLDFYRRLMYEYSLDEYSELKTEFTKGKKTSLFRTIMTRNTSKMMTLRPELYDGGISQYVKMLFRIKE